MERARRSALVLLLALLGSPIASPARASTIRTPQDDPPQILSRVQEIQNLLAFAVSPDGREAAVAVPAPRKNNSLLRLLTDGEAEPLERETRGLALALLYDGDGGLYGLFHRPSKKFGGETYLARIDRSTLRVEIQVRAPTRSFDMDEWSSEAALLVAAEDEIRSFMLPTLRSGPLYRVPGLNRAVESLGAGSRILIGQEDSLILVDLDDRPGPEAMPVRERVSSPAAVTSLAASADGGHALARLSDGRLFDIGFAPLAMKDAGTALALSDPPATPEAEQVPPPALETTVAAGAAAERAGAAPVPRAEQTDASSPAPDRLAEAPEDAPEPPSSTAAEQGAATVRPEPESEPQVAVAQERSTPPEPSPAKPADTDPAEPDPSPAEGLPAAAASSTAAREPASTDPEESPALAAGASPPADTAPPTADPGTPDFEPNAAAVDSPPPVDTPPSTADTGTPDLEAAVAGPVTPPPAGVDGPVPGPGQVKTDAPASAPAGAEVAEVPPPAAAGAPAGRIAQLSGRVDGDLQDLVAVVLLGPDNVLREARRLEPGADGRWTADGLAPGRYRVQADGGGSSVLITQPPFVTVTLTAEGSAQAPPLRILGRR